MSPADFGKIISDLLASDAFKLILLLLGIALVNKRQDVKLQSEMNAQNSKRDEWQKDLEKSRDLLRLKELEIQAKSDQIQQTAWQEMARAMTTLALSTQAIQAQGIRIIELHTTTADRVSETSDIAQALSTRLGLVQNELTMGITTLGTKDDLTRQEVMNARDAQLGVFNNRAIEIEKQVAKTEEKLDAKIETFTPIVTRLVQDVAALQGITNIEREFKESTAVKQETLLNRVEALSGVVPGLEQLRAILETMSQHILTLKLGTGDLSDKPVPPLEPNTVISLTS